MTTSTTFGLRPWFTVALLALLGACGSSSSDGGGAAGAAGMHPGSAGATGAAGSVGGSPGTGGDAAGVGGGAAGSTSPGAAGANAGAAGDGTAGASSGVAGSGAAGASSGVAGNVGAAGSRGGTAGAVGTPDGGTAGSGSDGGPPSDGGARSSKILIYGVTTGFRHGSITAAANAITAAAATHGLTTELVGCTDATNTPDPTKLSAQAFAGYGAVILLANSGEPYGYPATTEIQNLVDYVTNGGALIAIEDADHCYDGGFNGHPASPAYVNLIGNDFIGHPGGVAPATCTKMGTNPSVAQLPATFGTTDEIYQETKFRMDNQIVLSCTSSGSTPPTMRPVSYVREEGAGRMFYTALGHTDVVWTAAMDSKAASTRLVEDHVIPALLWAMRR